MYLRPFHISLENSLGVKSPHGSQILVVGSPVGPYYPTGFKSISLTCSTHYMRSAPKGTGGFKIGGYKFNNLETMDPLSLLRTKPQKKVINKSYICTNKK